MKKQTKILEFSETLIKGVIKKSLERDINHSTCMTLYQPKVPAEIQRFCKKNKEWLVLYQKNSLSLNR